MSERNTKMSVDMSVVGYVSAALETNCALVLTSDRTRRICVGERTHCE